MSRSQVKTTTSDITSTTKPPRSKRLRRGLQFGAVTFALSCSLGAWIHANHEDTARLSVDTRVIVRFPKSVFAELMQNEIREEFPILEQAGDLEVTGHAVASGRVSVEIESDTHCQSADHSVIAVRVIGETQKSLVGRQSGVTVLGTGHGQFEATKRIHFDGHDFRADGQTTVAATHETEIDDVETSVGGPFRLLASRKARAAVPSVNEIAIARIRQRVAECLDDIVAGVLPQLKLASRLDDAIARLHPSVDGWRIQVTSNEHVVQAALIPDGGRSPELPDLVADNIEVWMRLTPAQRIGMNLLNLGDQSYRLLGGILPESQARALTQQLRIGNIDDWTRVQVSATSLTNHEA